MLVHGRYGVSGEFERPSVFGSEGDVALRNGGHFGGMAVDEAGSGVVSGPSDTISGSEFDILGTIDANSFTPYRQRASAWPDSRGERVLNVV